jgi:hypothetical protein
MTLLLLPMPLLPMHHCCFPCCCSYCFPCCCPFSQFKQYLQNAIKKKWVASKARKSEAAQAAQQAMQQEAAAIAAAPADIQKHFKKGKGPAQEPYVYFATVSLNQPLKEVLPYQPKRLAICR